VLHRIDAAEEESILECIEEDDPELAEQIRDLLYVFQDVVELDGRAIQRLLKEVETKELALALKGATPEAREKIFENMTKRAKEVILEDMEFMGPVRLADIEGAQKSILMTLRRLREEGTVELANESVSAASEKE
jgi:flagellar motor switch protein FliG